MNLDLRSSTPSMEDQFALSSLRRARLNTRPTEAETPEDSLRAMLADKVEPSVSW
jgi:hypothetical protein